MQLGQYRNVISFAGSPKFRQPQIRLLGTIEMSPAAADTYRKRLRRELSWEEETLKMADK